MSRGGRLYKYLGLLIGIFLLDRLLKWAAVFMLERTSSFFYFSYLVNPAGAFSFPLPLAVVIFLGIIALTAVVYIFLRARRLQKGLMQAGTILMFAGGWSNLLDRLAGDGVVDVFHFSFGLSFNLADVYLIVGFIILLF